MTAAKPATASTIDPLAEIRNKVAIACKLEKAQHDKEIHGKIQHEEDTGPSMLPVPSWKDLDVTRFLVQPKPQEFIFDGLLPKGIVGSILAAGGSGKSFLLMQAVGVALATGKQFSIFKPVKATKVLYVAAEDPNEELHRRTYAIANRMGVANNPDLSNLGAISVYGRFGPLISRDANGNPAPTIYARWLEQTIEANRDVEVVLLDPLSRLFGLEENSNGDATAFIALLEGIAHRFGITIIFAHHESKAASKNSSLQENSGRGASGFIDGCRWAMVMRTMTAEDGKRFKVNPREHVEIDIRKTNYTAKLPASVFLKRGPDGVLEDINISKDLLKIQTSMLANLIADSGEELSRRDLVKGESPAGKAIYKTIKENFKDMTIESFTSLMDEAVKAGDFIEEEVFSGATKKKKMILKPLLEFRGKDQ